MDKIHFSTPNHPSTWDAGEVGFIEFANNAEAKKAERIFNEMQAEITRLRADVSLTPLEKLAIEVLDASRENFTDVDGGWLQDKAESLGILKPIPVTVPCDVEGYCACAEYGFPSECYRYTDDVQAQREAYHSRANSTRHD